MATSQQQEQYDVLWSTTEGNPLLPASSVPTLNKSLATNAKQIIKAINEVLKNNQGTQNSLDSFIKNFNTYVALIGDTYADSTLNPKLTNIADNIILALDSLSESIKELDKTIKDKADTSVTDNITKSIKNINDSLSTLSDSIKKGTAGGGKLMDTKTVSLGAVTVPYDYSSIFNRMAYIPLSQALKDEIDFSKRLRVELFNSFIKAGYAKDFILSFCNTDLNENSINIGFTTDHNYLVLANKTSSTLQLYNVNLIYYPKGA